MKIAKNTDANMFIESPCFNCQKRWVDKESKKTCHSSCEKYQQYKNALQVENEQIWKEKKMQNELNAMEVTRYRRVMQSHGKKV